MGVRYVKFASLPVADQDRAARFYGTHFGLRVVVDTPYVPGWRWLELEIPGEHTRILLTRRGSEPAPEHPVMILVIEDMASTYLAMDNLGVQFELEPTPAPWDMRESYALFRDSEGNLIQLSDG